MPGRSRRGVLVAALAVGAALGGPAPADAQLDLCLSAGPPSVTAPGEPLRFGITPQLAGTAGGTQGEVAPEDPTKALGALHALEPPRRTLVMRLNRLFMSDGQAGIDRFADLAEQYRREGFEVESQIRYHPSPEQEGDMAAWEAFVRDAARTLGRNPAVVALTITNEVNLPISANTSDGAYAGALDAIVRGVVAARQELDAMGRSDVKLGFSYAYRYLPEQDLAFWDGIGQRATPEFLAALDHVGLQLYPGLFWPPAFTPGQTAGDATIEALTLVRDCFMPRAGLGRDVGIWITEEGFATNLNRTLQRQVTDLTTTVEKVFEYSATLGVTDFRYFNLRDNDSDGGDLFDAVGLLFDEYTPKPAFDAYRELIERFGIDDPSVSDPPMLELRLRCDHGDLRAKVRGPDRHGVKRVRFRVGPAAVATDRRLPFRKILPAAALGGHARWKVVAALKLAGGGDDKLRAIRDRCR